jgi:hypothetical protein
MNYEIYYANRFMTRGDEPTFSPQTHTFMGMVAAVDAQGVFNKLNVEEHDFPRSMSVGDVVCEEGTEEYLMCWFTGWKRVG